MFSKNKNGCFDCDKCPRNNDPKLGRFCHLWWETQWTNASGETRIEKTCGLRQLPLYLTEVIKASNRPAAAVESMRNEMSRGLFAIAQATQEAGQSQSVIGDDMPHRAISYVTE
jgi:hypothetical protein